jgi:hypothetical protein
MRMTDILLLPRLPSVIAVERPILTLSIYCVQDFLYNGALHSTKYCYGYQFKDDEMGRACSMYRRAENAYKILIEKLEGTRSLRIRAHRWEDNIKTDLREIGWGCGLN